MPRSKHESDDSVGQPRRASDSRPRPGSGTPTERPGSGAPPNAPDQRSEQKPSSSPSPLDPGRPTRND